MQALNAELIAATDRKDPAVPYTRKSMQADLERIGVSAWQWAGKEPGKMRSDVQARLAAEKATGGAGSFDEIVEYCWFAYEKSQGASGDQVIGRTPHLTAAGLFDKVAEILEGKTSFDARGNVLNVDKWGTCLNDAWLLGGVHRHAMFRLVSPRVIENLWNENGYFVVTAREIIGLLNFGYRHEQVGPWQVFSCKDRSVASGADLIKYDALIKSGETIGRAQTLIDGEGSEARAQKQVADFLERNRS